MCNSINSIISLIMSFTFVILASYLLVLTRNTIDTTYESTAITVIIGSITTALFVILSHYNKIPKKNPVLWGIYVTICVCRIFVYPYLMEKIYNIPKTNKDKLQIQNIAISISTLGVIFLFHILYILKYDDKK